MHHTKQLVRHLQSLDIPVEQRNEYLCTAVAVGLASRLPLPTGKVKNIQGYYNDTHRRDVVMFINAVNEDIVFDAREALDLVTRAYMLRYAFAFEPQAFNVQSHLCALMGVDDLVTPVKYKGFLSNAGVAKTANEVQRTVMAVYENYLNEKQAESQAPQGV